MLTMVHSNGMSQAMGFGADEVVPAPSNGTRERVAEITAEASPVVKKFIADTRAGIGKIQRAERTATLIGVGGGVVGVGLGAGVGAWAGSGNRIVTTVGAGAGAFGLGLLAFFLSRRIMMPPLPTAEVAKSVVGAVANAAPPALDIAQNAIAPNGRYHGSLGYAS